MWDDFIPSSNALVADSPYFRAIFADVFSLGVILYELLTGKVAFDRRHTTDVLRATLHEHPTPISRLNDDVVRPIAELIDRMIAKKPRKRPRDMQVVIDTIDEILVSSPRATPTKRSAA